MSIFNNYKELSEIKNFDSEQYDIEGDIEEEQKENKPIIIPIILIGIIIFVSISLKLANLQIIQGEENLYAAQGNFIRKRIIPASRGLIYDVKGQLLLKNTAAQDLVIYPGELPQNKSERLKLYDQLINGLSIDRGVLQNIEEKQLRTLAPIVIKENLTQEDAVKTEVEIANLSGVAVVMRPSREYINDYGLPHIIGYTSKITDKELNQDTGNAYRLDSVIGRSGIEASYESQLKGTDGYSIVEVDSKGKVVQTRPGQDPKIGDSVTLTIDLDLQKKVYEIVQNYINEKKNNKVVALVAKTQTGEIESMVSTPGYDDNAFLKGMSQNEYQSLISNKDYPLLNRSISGTYPSGSSIKPVIAAAALNEGVINENTVIATPPVITVGQWTFPDNKAHGSANVKKAIAESNNVFFYIVGGGYENIKGLGIQKEDEYLTKFGFSQKTGIDLPGEQAGYVPTPENKKATTKESWYIGDTYHLSIGQGGFLVTPMQMIRAISAIANGGTLVTPHLIKSIDNKNWSNNFQPLATNIVPDNILKIVRDGMRQTVTDGSAKSLRDLPVEVAGKTGTAQFGNEGKTHAWFVCFAPYTSAEHTIVVLVESGGEGWDQAEPIAKQILQYLYPKN